MRKEKKEEMLSIKVKEEEKEKIKTIHIETGGLIKLITSLSLQRQSIEKQLREGYDKILEKQKEENEVMREICKAYDVDPMKYQFDIPDGELKPIIDK